MVMTKTELETIEETHALGYATYYSEDGSRETEIEVCTHCEDSGEYRYAATFPCETLQKAVAEWDEQEAAKETPVIGECVVSFDGKQERVITHHVKPEEAVTCIDCLRPQCLACLEPVEKCSTPKLHEFLHTNRALHNKREIHTINTADTVSERD